MDGCMSEFDAPTAITTKAVLRQGIASTSASPSQRSRPPVPTRAHIRMWLCCMLWTLPGPLAAVGSESASILLPPRVLIQFAAVERLRERAFRSCAARPAKEYGGDCSRLRARCAGEGECYVHSSSCVLRVSVPDIEGWDGCTYQFERPFHRSRASVSLILRDRM